MPPAPTLCPDCGHTQLVGMETLMTVMSKISRLSSRR